MHKYVIGFVGVLSSLLGIVSFIIYLYNLSFHYAFEFFLLSVITALSVVIFKLFKDIAELSNKLDKPCLDSYFENLALQLYKDFDPLVFDDNLRFTMRSEYFSLSGSDGEFKYEFQGFNASNKSVAFIREQITDDSPINSLIFNAKDNNTGYSLDWKVIKDQKYIQILEIYFTHPLAPGELFDISFSYTLLDSFKRKEEYVFYPEHIFKKGTNVLSASLQLEFPPMRYELLKVDNDECDVLEQPILEQGDGAVLIKFTIKNPKSLYVLKFVRSIK